MKWADKRILVTDAGGELRPGQLDAVRDFTYVANTADGFIRVAEADACLGRVTNLGSSSGVPVRDLAQTIASALPFICFLWALVLPA